TPLILVLFRRAPADLMTPDESEPSGVGSRPLNRDSLSDVAADWLLASHLSPLSGYQVKGPEFQSLMARLVVHGRSPESPVQIVNWRSESKEQSRASLARWPQRSLQLETCGYC